MDSLSSSFTVEVNGVSIAKVEDNGEDQIQAKTGPEAAVFELKDGRLQCGDWVLGRSLVEDRSMLPKKVSWFKAGADNEKRIQRVTAHQDGDAYQLKFANACLISEDGQVFADLLGGEQSNVAVKMQQE
ncbi:hypothetical protein P153DRAFT_336488 [Dothidotthia symphoricarpi CBS 119687]|uniref:Uncharacterized protein n=1 Tax=Dothidotthia symphoricarpi CBS 119687 TaxID=1392245 RepID=A0A6A6AHX1_9PLEO|nr:uncharacterized protein P153DRAFT_336488 [Dothidotthia symphoricarpi CBS 119687]KAF2130695.1 hypothetical protein P153DRAFT_336488 [Dothidotthia symphoricarpi CBS 119687]